MLSAADYFEYITRLYDSGLNWDSIGEVLQVMNKRHPGESFAIVDGLTMWWERRLNGRGMGD